MSGKLRLNGATSGYSELQAPDVAGDQTYILPSVGGELVTKQGGGKVVGYQQGLWTPKWVKGVAPDSYVSTFGKWSRTGNLVFIAGRIQGSGGSVNSDAVQLGDLPYKQIPVTGEGCVTIGYPGGLFGDPNYPFWALLADGKTYIQFYSNSGNTLIGSNVTATSKTLHFSCSYLTDDTTFVPINGATIS